MDLCFQELRAQLERSPGKPVNLPGLSLRESAVLVPIFVRDGVPYVLFTKRPATLRTHAGQISFPGGTRDPEDATPLHTALREMQEELGISADRIEVLGLLDEIPTITEFRIAPFVARIAPDQTYRPNADEVAEIIEAPIPHLLDASSVRTEKWTVRGQTYDVYFYEYGGHVIWGATARILNDLLNVLAGLPSWRHLLER